MEINQLSPKHFLQNLNKINYANEMIQSLIWYHEQIKKIEIGVSNFLFHLIFVSISSYSNFKSLAAISTISILKL